MDEAGNGTKFRRFRPDRHIGPPHFQDAAHLSVAGKFHGRMTLAERSAKVMVRTNSCFCPTGEKPSF
ncbi:hypothetical protein M2281_003483 [Mesorhizobium soli]|nr:hypothetical protein [Mesorhizobium soli]